MAAVTYRSDPRGPWRWEQQCEREALDIEREAQERFASRAGNRRLLRALPRRLTTGAHLLARALSWPPG
jgi:hypothetical protein